MSEASNWQSENVGGQSDNKGEAIELNYYNTKIDRDSSVELLSFLIRTDQIDFTQCSHYSSINHTSLIPFPPSLISISPHFRDCSLELLGAR